ncbi:MAG: hypothetical protein KDB07_00525 [Planctomycetes bacterium]|nr:hypothetical protein [Planctomycetota bacterium]
MPRLLIFALASVFVLSACGSPNANSPSGANKSNKGNRVVSDGGSGLTYDTKELLGSNDPRVKISATEYFDPRYNEEQQGRFLRMRCLELGKALVLLNDSSSARRALGREEVERIQNVDRQHTERWQRANQGMEVVGLVIPRYISEELYKDQAKQNLDWLASQGRLLQAAYKLETFSTEAWNDAAVEMCAEGPEGKEFFIAQMIRRLALGTPKYASLAQELLANYAPKEAIPYLVASAHIDMASSAGVFPKRVAETLGLIGPDAEAEILKVYHNKDGEFLPVSDSSFRVRRYLSQTLGHIGKEKSLNVLANDLLRGQITSDTSKFIYDLVLVEAIGNFRNKEALGAIKQTWAAYHAKSDYALDRTARDAVRKILGKTYMTPDEVPNE